MMTPVTDHADFARAIVADPDDDGPRLVYADWLDEHGQPDRAEFIRAQIERERLPPGDPRWRDLRRREKELLARLGDAWALPLADKCESPRRGFVEKIGVGCRQLLTHADALFAAAPLTGLKPLRLNQTKNAAGDLAKLPHLARLRELDLADSGAGDDNLRRLLASPHLAGLRHLRVSACRLQPSGWQTLLAHGPPALEHLEAHYNYLGWDGAAPPDRAPPFRLRTLSLSSNHFTSAALRVLVRWPGLAGVTDLRVGRSPWATAGPDALAALAGLPNLDALDVRASGLGPTDVAALAAAPALRRLYLDENAPDEHGLAGLFAGPVGGRLEVLSLKGCFLSPAALGLLAAWPGLGRLRYLGLGSNRFGDDGLRTLLRSPHAAGLRGLDLSHCEVTADGVRDLLASPLAQSLEWLVLEELNSRREVAELILAADPPRLRHLALGSRVPVKLKRQLDERYDRPAWDEVP